jgi:hypothetical protein
MTQITELQFEDLVHRIYETLLSSDDMGLGEAALCHEEAERTAIEWCRDNNITFKDLS